MGKRINWEYANIRDKVAGNPFDNSYDWRELKSLRDTTCEACTRRIKKGQMMMWYVKHEFSNNAGPKSQWEERCQRS